MEGLLGRHHLDRRRPYLAHQRPYLAIHVSECAEFQELVVRIEVVCSKILFMILRDAGERVEH